MNCPKCDESRLGRSRVGDTQVVVDACGLCRGIWFDAGELRQILPVANAEIAPPKSAKRTAMVCPRCRAPLKSFNYPRTCIEIDMCDNCLGIWLDSGEFKEIRSIREDLETKGELEGAEANDISSWFDSELSKHEAHLSADTALTSKRPRRRPSKQSSRRHKKHSNLLRTLSQRLNYLVATGVCITAGIACFMVSLATIESGEATLDWVETEFGATGRERTGQSSPYDTDYNTYYEMAYEVDGRYYMFWAGSKLIRPIYYDPDWPSKTTFIQGVHWSHVWLWRAGAGAVGVLALSFLWLAVFGSKHDES